jgi:hypothetical protein
MQYYMSQMYKNIHFTKMNTKNRVEWIQKQAFNNCKKKIW